MKLKWKPFPFLTRTKILSMINFKLISKILQALANSGTKQPTSSPTYEEGPPLLPPIQPRGGGGGLSNAQFGAALSTLNKQPEQTPTAAALSPKLEVVNYLRNKGYKPESIAGILGNIGVETGGSFDPLQKQIGGGGGHGLFQYDFLKPYYHSWRGDSPDTVEAQLDFMHDMIYGESQNILGKGNAAKLRKAFDTGDVKTATEAFMNLFERPGKPHTERRLSLAEKYYNDFLKDG